MSNGYRGSKQVSARPVAHKPLTCGRVVYTNVSHPMERRSIYLCEARVIRVPTHRSDVRYKVMITGVQGQGRESTGFLNRVIGMKILRNFDSLMLQDPGNRYTIAGTWHRLDTPTADQLFKRAVANILREPARQAKNGLARL